MSEAGEFREWVDRLQGGDPGAAGEVLQRFTARLIALARSRLDARLRAKVDPEDVAQSAFKSFFLRQARGEFDLGGWDAVWSLLTLITLRKCARQREHFHAGRRDVARESAPAGAGESGADWAFVARDPTPDEAAALTETVEQLFAGLPAGDRPVVEMALQGYSAAEISGHLGRAERTIYRTLARVRAKLRQLDPIPGEDA